MLRLFLATAVVVQHFSHFHLGHWAVCVFFILSGYWISVMYRKKYRLTKTPVLTFWCSRYLRLAPVYLACTGLALVIIRLTSRHWFDFAMLHDPAWVLRTLAIVSSSSQHWVVIVPAWSLDVEMQFYLLAPLLLLALARARIFASVLIIIGLAITGLFVGTTVGLPSNLVFFLSGAVIDRSHWRPGRGIALASLAAFAGIVCAVLLTPAWQPLLIFASVPMSEPSYRLTLILAFVCLPMVAYTLEQPSDALDKHAGDLAYSVYLFHPCVYLVANYLAGFPSPTRVFLSHWAWLLVAPGSLAVYLLVDRPAEVLRKRFVASRLRKGVVARQYPIAEPVGT